MSRDLSISIHYFWGCKIKGHKRIAREIQDSRIDQIVQMKIAGRTIIDIATQLKLTRSTVHRLLKKDTAVLKMTKTRQEIAKVAGQVADQENKKIIQSVEEKIKSYAEYSLDRMRDMTDSENEFVVTKAASDLMDRDPRMSKTKNTKMTGGVIHAIVTAEQLQIAARTARELQNIGVVVPALPITGEMLGLEEESVAASD